MDARNTRGVCITDDDLFNFDIAASTSASTLLLQMSQDTKHTHAIAKFTHASTRLLVALHLSSSASASASLPPSTPVVLLVWRLCLLHMLREFRRPEWAQCAHVRMAVAAFTSRLLLLRMQLLHNHTPVALRPRLSSHLTEHALKRIHTNMCLTQEREDRVQELLDRSDRIVHMQSQALPFLLVNDVVTSITVNTPTAASAETPNNTLHNRPTAPFPRRISMWCQLNTLQKTWTRWLMHETRVAQDYLNAQQATPGRLASLPTKHETLTVLQRADATMNNIVSEMTDLEYAIEHPVVSFLAKGMGQVNLHRDSEKSKLPEPWLLSH